MSVVNESSAHNETMNIIGLLYVYITIHDIMRFNYIYIYILEISNRRDCLCWALLSG